mgnify:CR=1 FL=1
MIADMGWLGFEKATKRVLEIKTYSIDSAHRLVRINNSYWLVRTNGADSTSISQERATQMLGVSSPIDYMVIECGEDSPDNIVY